MCDIYTRNFSSRREKTEYTPPPGYDGTVFADSGGMKMHTADTIITLPEINEERAVEDSSDGDLSEMETHSDSACVIESADNPVAATRDLISSLREKIGTEELILILVLLVVASEGIGPEALILALLLIAG